MPAPIPRYPTHGGTECSSRTDALKSPTVTTSRLVLYVAFPVAAHAPSPTRMTPRLTPNRIEVLRARGERLTTCPSAVAARSVPVIQPRAGFLELQARGPGLRASYDLGRREFPFLVRVFGTRASSLGTTTRADRSFLGALTRQACSRTSWRS